MRLFACLLTVWAGVALADQPTKTTGTMRTKPVPKTAMKRPPTGLTVPPDAKEVSPGLYHWTDKTGKGWMYRRTPFGVSRWADDSEDTKRKAVAEQTTAVEQGDSIRFERSSPFGKRTWVRKKSELDETEQQIWARQQEKNSASRKADKE